MGWQPIEAAPRSVERAIVFDGKDVRFASRGPYSGWADAEIGEYHEPITPTHWMPLPEPPSDSGSRPTGEDREAG